MRLIPLLSLGIALGFAGIAWRQRHAFVRHPYRHWFIYLHLTAVGLHQFEEYGWPGGFHDSFVAIFPLPQATTLIPSTTELELLNALVLTTLFGLLGWLGTRHIWLGLGTLWINLANGFFHLIYSVTQMTYIPGTITGTVLYLPLGLLACYFAAARRDIDGGKLLLACALGTCVSLAPFLHVWLLHWSRLR